MSPEEAQRIERDMEQVKREMYRKSRDTIRIYNPLETDFKFFYDGYPNIVKAQQTKDVERYIARHYFKKIADFIIGQLSIIKGQELIKERTDRGMPSYLNKYTENKEVWDNTPKQNDPVLLEQVAEQVILGLVEEYGLELPDEIPAAYKPVDLRPLHDQIIDMFDKKIADDTPQERSNPEAAPIREKLKLEIENAN